MKLTNGRYTVLKVIGCFLLICFAVGFITSELQSPEENLKDECYLFFSYEWHKAGTWGDASIAMKDEPQYQKCSGLASKFFAEEVYPSVK